MTAAPHSVSVVVGVLNGAKTLERCIDSIAAQTLPGVELVVKDAASTDETVRILERRSRDIAYWISEPDTGLYDAWNRVIPRCRGKWICFLGCDDTLAHPTVLERLVEAIPEHDPPELVSSLNVFVDGHGRFIKVVGQPLDWQLLKSHAHFAHAGLLHRADLFTKFGGFDATYKIGADYEFLLRLGPQTRALFVDQITVRVGADGMSHSRWTKTFSEHWRLQANNPEVGRVRATKNYTRRLAWFAARKLLGRR